MADKKSGGPDSAKSQSKARPLPPAVNFLNGGLSGMFATCFVHPMDVVKNRMQMRKEGKVSVVDVVSTIFKEEGLLKFYRGLSAGLVRQATYTTTRLGVYNQLQDSWKERHASAPGFFILCAMAVTAGSAGAFAGTPTEVALVRMTSDGRLPPEQRRNYKNVIDAFMRIVKEEGASTLWRGSIITIGRAAIVNVSQLATYSQTKSTLATKFNVKEGIAQHFYASMFSGLVTAFNSMPFDIAKTRVQNLKSSEKAPGMFKIIFTIARTEGIFALWKGFLPTYCRIGPHTVLTFVFNEQFAKFYREYFM